MVDLKMVVDMDIYVKSYTWIKKKLDAKNYKDIKTDLN